MARLGRSNLASYREILHKKVYPDGFTFLFQPVNHVASVSCGLYLRRGSSSELDSELGYFHFIEHMLFKGTKKRSSKEIVESIERVGGVINAVTSREYTSYYVSLIRDELHLALDILSDMVYNPLLRKSDIEIERKVIIEEIKSYEDNPEDYLYDEYYSSLFNGHPLGRNIAGTKSSVNEATESSLRDFYSKHYKNENLILAVAGNSTVEEVEALVEKFFLKKSKTQKKHSNLKEYFPPIEKQFIKKAHKRKIEQVNFYLGAEGFARSNSKSPALILASNILGGGMASRLFQKVREKHGYCYGIQSFPSGYQNTGVTSIFCATSPENTSKSIEIILKEIESIIKKGFSKKELDYSITNIIGGLAMGYEMTESRMNNIAAQEIYYGRFYSLLERIELIARVSLDEMNSTFREVFGLDQFHLSLIGDLSGNDVKKIPHSLSNNRT